MVPICEYHQNHLVKNNKCNRLNRHRSMTLTRHYTWPYNTTRINLTERSSHHFTTWDFVKSTFWSLVKISISGVYMRTSYHWHLYIYPLTRHSLSLLKNVEDCWTLEYRSLPIQRNTLRIMFSLFDFRILFQNTFFWELPLRLYVFSLLLKLQFFTMNLRNEGNSVHRHYSNFLDRILTKSLSNPTLGQKKKT